MEEEDNVVIKYKTNLQLGGDNQLNETYQLASVVAFPGSYGQL